MNGPATIGTLSVEIFIIVEHERYDVVCCGFWRHIGVAPQRPGTAMNIHTKFLQHTDARNHNSGMIGWQSNTGGLGYINTTLERAVVCS